MSSANQQQVPETKIDLEINNNDDEMIGSSSSRRAAPRLGQSRVSAFEIEAPPEDRKWIMDIGLPFLNLKPSAKKILAEFIGTYMLIFVAVAAPIVNKKYDNAATLVGVSVATGLAVMVIIFSTGHISGAHLNPAVTIAFSAIRHLPWTDVPGYITAQILGSISASYTLKGIFQPLNTKALVTVPSSSISVGQAFAFEFIVSFILMFVIAAAATDNRSVRELAAVAIGAVVSFDIMIAGDSTGASMNPARSLGPAIASGIYTSIWIYIFAPTLGATVGAFFYTAIKL